MSEDAFQLKIKRLQDAARLISYQKEQLELGKKQTEHSIRVLEKEKPGYTYLKVGPIFIKYSDETAKSKLNEQVKNIESQLRVLDKRMNQIWAESRKLQEEMKKSR